MRKTKTMKGLILTTATLAMAGTALLPVQATAQTPLDAITITASRLFNGITGTSTTVLSAQDIERVPGQTVQDVLATIPGVQLQSLYGGTGGVGTVVDLRGFGAFATSNTLVLINGRRVNDLDMAGVDFATIPRQSIERIEVTRGNSGAVLYGDNAVGGVINIVTKTGVGKPASFRAEAGLGSFNQTDGNASLTTSHGAWSTAAFVNGLASDGYRANNHVRQVNGVGEVRYNGPGFSAFFNVSGDDQKLGLPGARLVTNATSELVTARRGAATPLDHAEKQGLNATTGFTKTLWDGVELIVDGGVRDKQQQGTFLTPFSESYVDSTLQTWSLTPRLNITHAMFGLPSRIVTGLDYYDADYHSKRSQFQGQPAIHVYDLQQRSVAGYWQQTLAVLPTTDFSYGGRLQSTDLDARDRYNAAAPGAFGAQSFPLNKSETNHALHVGFEHRFNDNVAAFGRAARAFRTPNVDERLITGIAFDPNNFFAPIPQNFQLKTQTSHDIEAGLRFNFGALTIQSSVYDMWLKNEIHYNPVDMYNYNLDPTRRTGSETSATYVVNESLRLRGGFAITRAVFREGPFDGKDVPLVSRYTANAGFAWNIWKDYLVLDTLARYWSDRYLDNDQNNRQPKIPGEVTLDLKLSGQVEKMFWSLAINNVFDSKYYDYGVASATTLGTFNAYPLPGRTYTVKAGVTF